MIINIERAKQHMSHLIAINNHLNFFAQGELPGRIIIEKYPVEDSIDIIYCVQGKEDAKRRLAIECAKKALPIFEREYPNDKRPYQVISSTEAYVFQKESTDYYVRKGIQEIKQCRIDIFKSDECVRSAVDSSLFAAMSLYDVNHYTRHCVLSALNALMEDKDIKVLMLSWLDDIG